MGENKKQKKGPTAQAKQGGHKQHEPASKKVTKAQLKRKEKEDVEDEESGDEGFQGEEWEGQDESGAGDASSGDDDSDDEDEEDEIRMFGQVEEEDDSEEEEAAAGKGKGKRQAESAAQAAGGKKRKRKAGKGKGKDDEDGVMNVTFEVSDPDERFFFGIRSLLSYLNHEGLAVSALSELVVSEPGLGSVVHCADETDVFALATALPIASHKSNEAVSGLCKLLESQCPASLLPSLRKVLGDEGSYVLLHHRFVNLPLPLVPVLHKSIREDLTWAVKNTKGLPKVKHLLLLCPCAADLSPSTSRDGKGKKKATPTALPYAPSDAIYTHFEDELLVQKSELSFCFSRSLSSPDSSSAAGGQEAEAGAMVVCVISEKDHADAIPEMESMAGQLA